jgi:Tol biopolymer transport system component
MKKIVSAFSIVAFLGSVSFAQEVNIKNLRQLTNGGDNAEAYFSPDGTKLTMQVTNPKEGVECDQIYELDLSIQNPTFKDLKLISTGTGRTTCSFFMPDGKHILYASTHEGGHACPAPPKANGKYLWPIFPEFDIYVSDLNGKIVNQLTNTPGYDAEAVLSPDGKKIAFTSLRTGDLEVYTMDLDGSNVKQITFGLGYDGGAFFSHDSKKLVFRSSRPKTEEEIKEYKDLLSQGLVAPTNMEIYTVNVDGTDLKQVTNLGKANWSPYFHPSDKSIIFSSNHHSVHGYDFQLFMIDADGTNLRQITFESNFNAFPMFSPDGKKLVYASNRVAGKPKETNVYIADWVETDAAEVVQDKQLKKHVSTLASDKMEGRLTGSKGEQKAAKYLSSELKKYGLKPYEGKSYLQKFNYKVRLNPHDSASTKDWHGTNVIGVLDNGAKNTIVIGAHYDHLGRNEHHHSTKVNSEGEIHNGADDNASGTAALLELARMYATNNTKEKVNYVFAFFSGEEDGLIGSKYMAESLKSKFSNVLTMINMDMIGRLSKDKALVIGGVGSSPDFSPIIDKTKPAGFTITIDSSGVGPSDHTSFYLKDIPVLFFFTGTHMDYHKPSDDEEKINYYGLRAITGFAARVANQIADKGQMTFTKTKVETGKRTPKYKVTLGVMPDYTDHGDGLHIDGVVDGKAAANAGVVAGDILIAIGDCTIKDVYGYMECLSKLQAGDERELIVIRQGKEVKLKAAF